MGRESKRISLMISTFVLMTNHKSLQYYLLGCPAPLERPYRTRSVGMMTQKCILFGIILSSSVTCSHHAMMMERVTQFVTFSCFAVMSFDMSLVSKWGLGYLFFYCGPLWPLNLFLEYKYVGISMNLHANIKSIFRIR